MVKATTPLARFPLLAMLVISAMLGGTGCTVATMAGKAVTTTVGLAADVTVATVRGSGKVAAAAVGASGDVADESLKAATKLSQSGMVVFFDPNTGSTWRAPVQKGLKLYAASQTANVSTGLAAMRLIRSGKAMSLVGQAANLVVKSGDVIELARRL